MLIKPATTKNLVSVVTVTSWCTRNLRTLQPTSVHRPDCGCNSGAVGEALSLSIICKCINVSLFPSLRSSGWRIRWSSVTTPSFVRSLTRAFAPSRSVSPAASMVACTPAEPRTPRERPLSPASWRSNVRIYRQTKDYVFSEYSPYLLRSFALFPRFRSDNSSMKLKPA